MTIRTDRASGIDLLDFKTAYRKHCFSTIADYHLANPADTDHVPLAEELRKLIAEMPATVEEKLDLTTKL